MKHFAHPNPSNWHDRTRRPDIPPMPLTQPMTIATQPNDFPPCNTLTDRPAEYFAHSNPYDRHDHRPDTPTDRTNKSMPLTHQPTTTQPYANNFPPCNAPTDPLAEHFAHPNPSDRRPDIPSITTVTTNKLKPLKQPPALQPFANAAALCQAHPISLFMSPRPQYYMHHLNLTLSLVVPKRNPLSRRPFSTVLDLFPDQPG